jgi:two-component system LytT family response regulator
MIKVIVIDDEPLARSIILDYLTGYPMIEVLAECGDGFEAAKAITNLQPDLIFLDIQMPKITGFEVLELLENKPHTIFTTAFDEYAIKAFEQHAIDYLLKPISKSRFDAAIQKFQQLQHGLGMKPNTEVLQSIQPMERIVVKNGSKINIIPIDDILYFQADDDYVHIHTETHSFIKKGTLSNLEKTLDSRIFVRAHRSNLLNVNYIQRIEPYERENYLAVLKNGMKLNVSKAGYVRIKQLLGL